MADRRCDMLGGEEGAWEAVTCWASVSDWNVMYQLLLCANSTLITLGQSSFLNRDSTSCGGKKNNPRQEPC